MAAEGSYVAAVSALQPGRGSDAMAILTADGRSEILLGTAAVLAERAAAMAAQRAVAASEAAGTLLRRLQRDGSPLSSRGLSMRQAGSRQENAEPSLAFSSGRAFSGTSLSSSTRPSNKAGGGAETPKGFGSGEEEADREPLYFGGISGYQVGGGEDKLSSSSTTAGNTVATSAPSVPTTWTGAFSAAEAAAIYARKMREHSQEQMREQHCRSAPSQPSSSQRPGAGGSAFGLCGPGGCCNATCPCQVQKLVVSVGLTLNMDVGALLAHSEALFEAGLRTLASLQGLVDAEAAFLGVPRELAYLLRGEAAFASYAQQKTTRRSEARRVLTPRGAAAADAQPLTPRSLEAISSKVPHWPQHGFPVPLRVFSGSQQELRRSASCTTQTATKSREAQARSRHVVRQQSAESLRREASSLRISTLRREEVQDPWLHTSAAHRSVNVVIPRFRACRSLAGKEHWRRCKELSQPIAPTIPGPKPPEEAWA
eukprot:TRINITY_DN58556_c0_g1_i1.p1 TRINITY_DN58556_c0_g1~~TRINITY_DN58556_c0_g1_i1.p1  ORF type:complete len:484 (-),score=105.64 TRINITY_DN58556_c0_g1_i1:53-1504(-)